MSEASALHLFDSRGRLLFDGPTNDAERQLVDQGASLIVRLATTGLMCGIYVDNETPDRDRVAGALCGLLPADQLIVVGLYPSEPGHRIAGCVCAYEWYPFHLGWGMPTRAALGLTRAQPMPEAWILQHAYAWPGDRPPSEREAAELLAFVAEHHPRAKLILCY